MRIPTIVSKLVLSLAFSAAALGLISREALAGTKYIQPTPQAKTAPDSDKTDSAIVMEPHTESYGYLHMTQTPAKPHHKRPRISAAQKKKIAALNAYISALEQSVMQHGGEMRLADFTDKVAQAFAQQDKAAETAHHAHGVAGLVAQSAMTALPATSKMMAQATAPASILEDATEEAITQHDGQHRKGAKALIEDSAEIALPATSRALRHLVRGGAITAIPAMNEEELSRADWELRLTKLLPDWAEPEAEDDGTLSSSVRAFASAIMADKEEIERPGTAAAREEMQQTVKAMARFAAANTDMPKDVVAMGGVDMLILSCLADDLKEGDVGARVFIANRLNLIGESVRYDHAKTGAQRDKAMAGIMRSLQCMKEAARLSSAVAEGKLSREAFDLLTQSSVEAIATAQGIRPLPRAKVATKAGCGCGSDR